MVHTAVYGSSNIATEFLFDGNWDTIPFPIDSSLTTDGPPHKEWKTVRAMKCYLKKKEHVKMLSIKLKL